MAPTLKELIRCPHCNSAEIVYSCEPKCCYNHVCSECRSTFEINTAKTGNFDHTTNLDFSEPLSGDPTTGCANCDSLRVAVLSHVDGHTTMLCGKCSALLTLSIDEFVAGSF